MVLSSYATFYNTSLSLNPLIEENGEFSANTTFCWASLAVWFCKALRLVVSVLRLFSAFVKALSVVM